MKDISISQEFVDAIIKSELQADLGDTGDLTSRWTIPEDLQGKARFVAKSPGVLAGGPMAGRVFQLLDPSVTCTFQADEGSQVNAGQVVGEVHGPVRSILEGERTALNLLQRLSGIASETQKYVSAVKGTKAIILDTRKTTPGLRPLEKYAVVQGGGQNHRMGLFDMILIKDNHIDACGGIEQAIRSVLKHIPEHPIDIEVETRSIEDVKKALRYPVQRILLDNMTLETMREAVRLANGKIPLEASGNVNLKTVRSIAETGVDYISVGALTHSVQVLDISLQYQTT